MNAHTQPSSLTGVHLHNSDSDRRPKEAESAAENPPVIVIGSGPSGMRFVQELLNRKPEASVHLFGNEPYQPYNRVQLSQLLAGEINSTDIDIPLPVSAVNPHFRYTIAAIDTIDPAQKTVTDTLGEQYRYSRLIVATGSRPHLPNIPGIEQQGVYSFRNLKDTEFLYGRVARARHIVVVGGGLLGLEAARALLRANTRVTLVHQGSHLMNRQLDPAAADLLTQKVEALGIRIITNAGVREILGEGRITGIKTRAGEVILCDTVLLCTGITPNTKLARDAGLAVTRGIVVDDKLQTSNPDIYAIGECGEHRGQTYGLVKPGLEQAAVAADVITRGSSLYTGSLTVSRLKVMGEQVYSMGEVVELTQRPLQSEWVYTDRARNVYRKLVVHKGKLIGALGIGPWQEINRVQEAFAQGRRLWPWQLWLFRFSGRLWSSDEGRDIASWPANAVVCQCNNITHGQLAGALVNGCRSSAELQSQTGAGTVCGSCKPLLSELVGQQEPREKAPGWPLLWLFSMAALVLAGLTALWPEAQTSASVIEANWFESIWNDKFWKQVSGFSLLALSFLGLLMSLRKHAQLDWMGKFSHWRLFHIGLGVICAAILIFHTGFHLGSNLNRWLMLDFLAILGLGAVAGAVIAASHRFNPIRARRLRKHWRWFHTLVAWPLPALLGMHILSVYYF